MMISQSSSPVCWCSRKVSRRATDAALSHTSREKNPWWEVDLGEEAELEQIVIWNRTDQGLGSRLADFRVLALDARHERVWEDTIADPPKPSLALRPSDGQRVRRYVGLRCKLVVNTGGFSLSRG